jgi:hypothetical protein
MPTTKKTTASKAKSTKTAVVNNKKRKTPSKTTVEEKTSYAVTLATHYNEATADLFKIEQLPDPRKAGPRQSPHTATVLRIKDLRIQLDPKYRSIQVRVDAGPLADLLKAYNAQIDAAAFKEDGIAKYPYDAVYKSLRFKLQPVKSKVPTYCFDRGSSDSDLGNDKALSYIAADDLNKGDTVSVIFTPEPYLMVDYSDGDNTKRYVGVTFRAKLICRTAHVLDTEESKEAEDSAEEVDVQEFSQIFEMDDI